MPITSPRAEPTAPRPLSQAQLNRLEDEAESLAVLLRKPMPGASFDRIIDACNELRDACLGTHAPPGVDHLPTTGAEQGHLRAAMFDECMHCGCYQTKNGQKPETADSAPRIVDADFPGAPTVAQCIAQLDTWNGHLEAAIDRHAHMQLGQHANDEPAAGGRDPLEQLP